MGNFSVPVQNGPEAYPASSTVGTRSFPGIKRPGRVGDPTPRFSAEAVNTLEVFVRLPSVPP